MYCVDFENYRVSQGTKDNLVAKGRISLIPW